MDLNNAAQAIIGPCKVFNINIEEGFSEALIKILSPDSPEIELTYLQVFLDKIYRLALKNREIKKVKTWLFHSRWTSFRRLVMFPIFWEASSMNRYPFSMTPIRHLQFLNHLYR